MGDAYVRLGAAEPPGSADARDAMELIRQLWELPRAPRGAVPAPNPVSLLRANMRDLRREEYMVSAKLDGTRYLLLLGENETTGEPYSFLVDRAATVLRVRVDVDDPALYQGTLVDGELMPACRTFVAFDVVACGGLDCKPLDYAARLAQLRALLPRLRVREEGAGGLAVKPCAPLRQAARVAAQSPWPQDGLIFMPVRQPVRHGMHRGMFKWKPHHTIDFELVVTDGGPDLRYAGKHGPRLIATLDLALRAAPAAALLRRAPCIVECSVCLDTRRVQILAARPDKSTPNFERTVRLTLQNMRENITHDELVQWCAA